MTTHDHGHTDDPRSEQRMARLSALLEADLTDDIATRASAARMRPVIIAAAHRAGRTAQRTLLLRAAAIVVLLGGVAAVPPARAWVVEHVRQLAEVLGVSRADAPAADPGPDPAAGDARQADGDVRYTFDVAGPVLVVRIDAAAGTVVIRRSTGTRASAEAIDAPGTRFLVLPDGIAITSDDATAAARFIITAPPDVRAARVQMTDGEVQDVTVGNAERSVRIGGVE